MSKFLDRRQFLRQGVALGGMAASPMLLNLAAQEAVTAATTGTDYKALVCIFLVGGNDCHNTVLPVDAPSWSTYMSSRDPATQAATANVPLSSLSVTDTLALPRSSLLNIANANRAGLNTGRAFALHPQLKQVQQLYTAGKAAILANVGPLVLQTDRIDFRKTDYPRPYRLMSHNDQQSTWQSFAPEGSASGWGGRLMDDLAAQNANPMFSAIGINAPPLWLAGNQVLPYQVGPSTIPVMGGETGTIMGNAALYQAVRTVAGTADVNDPFGTDYAAVTSRALTTQAILRANLLSASTAPWGTAGVTAQAADPLLKYTAPATGASTFNPLAAQLQMVARLIAARNASQIGAKRQVFMVTLPGFDTHGGQMTIHADLLARLDHAIGYFYNLLGNMPDGVNMRSQVTTFTASDFGRTLMGNGDGTDHGWGGHHFIIGDAVKGGDVYGTFPLFAGTNGTGEFFSNDMLLGGVLIPTTSVDQYVYTLGRWLGSTDASLRAICPNLANFPATDMPANLGFLG